MPELSRQLSRLDNALSYYRRAFPRSAAAAARKVAALEVEAFRYPTIGAGQASALAALLFSGKELQ